MHKNSRKKAPFFLGEFSGIVHYLRGLWLKIGNFVKNILHTFRENCEILSEGFFVKIFIIFHKNNSMYIANHLGCTFFILSFFYRVHTFLYFYKIFVSKKNPRAKIPEHFTKKCTLFPNVTYWAFRKKTPFFPEKTCTLFPDFDKLHKKNNGRKKTKIFKKSILFIFKFFCPSLQ